MFKEPENDYEALVLALTLAVTAPTDQDADRCVKMGQLIAAKLTAEQIVAAQAEASAAAHLWQSQ
jgi:hypothetical protein